MPKVGARARPRAVGVYIFAGGFTLGVRAAGFDVLCHLEDGAFGVETARTNFPTLPIYDRRDQWPVDELSRVDLVYANPPCAPWSTAGIVKGQSREQQTDWRAHPLSRCVGDAFLLLKSLNPTIWCFESVRQAYSRGRTMIDDMAMTAMGMGYSVTDLFTEAKHFGVPQHRKRYFMVAHRVEIEWRPSKQDALPTVDEALRSADERDDMTGGMPKSVTAIVGEIGRGENARAVYDRMIARGDALASSRPAFIYDRMASDRPSYTLLGSCNKIHPHEDRMLSVNESKAICGYPRDFVFVGSMMSRYAQVGKGVCPPVAEWLGTQLRRAIETRRVVAPVRRKITVTADSVSEEVVDAQSGK